MHPCVCIRFTGFCLATGAPLLCSLRHAQLVPYRPWAETNELNPPPKRTRLERPARTFWKMASTDGGKMASTDGTCWILNMQHLNPLSVNILNLLCQVVEVQDAKLDTYKRIQRWWWACGCGEQSLFLDLWKHVYTLYTDFHRWQLFLFQCGWAHDCSEMSSATVVLFVASDWLLKINRRGGILAPTRFSRKDYRCQFWSTAPKPQDFSSQRFFFQNPALTLPRILEPCHGNQGQDLGNRRPNGSIEYISADVAPGGVCCNLDWQWLADFSWFFPSYLTLWTLALFGVRCFHSYAFLVPKMESRMIGVFLELLRPCENLHV